MDILSNIISDLDPKDQKAFTNLSSKGLNHEFIIHSLETGKRNFDRAESLQIVRSVDSRNKINEMYGNSLIYPMTLTFHQKDVPSLKKLDVLGFIRRVKTVVFEGAQGIVIEAKHPESDVEIYDNELSNILRRLHLNLIQRVHTLVFETGYFNWLGTSRSWSIEMYDPNSWALKQPQSLMEVLESDTVTAVKSLHLQTDTASLVVELSWSFTEGDVNWTATKTLGLHSVQREGVSTEEILLDQKLRNLESLNLSHTNVIEVSALVNLTNLKFLEMHGDWTNVDSNALKEILPKLEYFYCKM
jgi:hypothetical protein